VRALRWFLSVALVSATGLIGPSPASAAFPGTNGKIAFERLDDDFEIYSMNGDGTGMANLTANPSLFSDEHNPAWSPDGTRIAFNALREGQFDSSADMYAMNADGTGQTRLTSDPGLEYDPAWSPDGARIAFINCCPDGDAEIYVMNGDGTGQTNLTNHPAGDRSPAWSPDGTRIAFDTNRDDIDADEIYVMNADGTGQRNLSNHPAQDFSPVWSPDGTKIAFTSDRDGWSEVFVMNADGTGQQNLTNSDGEDLWPAWSPDGTKIAFISYRDQGNPDVFVMNADGTAQTNLTNSQASERTPDWQPLAGTISGDVVVTVTDFTYSPKAAVLAQGQTIKWDFRGPSAHSATDRSGMGLFDSGPRGAGSAYFLTLVGAGSYSYGCTMYPSQRGTIKVPVRASPTKGTTSTAFGVVWASATAPGGYVFDVQIRRPGASSFVPWKEGQTLQSAAFVPDGGPGKYAFRARLRNASSGKASGYSAPRSISVQ
jgi:Tol biopolymer transport system component